MQMSLGSKKHVCGFLILNRNAARRGHKRCSRCCGKSHKEPKYQDSSELTLHEGNVASLKSDNKEVCAEEVGKRSSSSGFEVLCSCIK